MDRLITDNISNRLKEGMYRQIFGDMFDGSKLENNSKLENSSKLENNKLMASIN